MIVDWRLRIGFAIFKFNFDFTLDYKWLNDNAIIFECVGGDLEYNFGSWEWFSIDDNTTILCFTTAVPLGKKSPFFMKFTKMIPNSQVLMGASTTAVTIEKLRKWIESQILNSAIK